jgi:cytochrome c peroxidase
MIPTNSGAVLLCALASVLGTACQEPPIEAQPLNERITPAVDDSRPPAVLGESRFGDEQFDFAEILARGRQIRPMVKERQQRELALRYDLSDRPLQGLTMTRGKAIQEGVRIKLPPGMTWDRLASLSPEQIRGRDLFPRGFLPLPHPNHTEGGMIFPASSIDEIKRQTGRDLERFDLDFDLPEIFLAEFPPAIFLTTRPELGDVSQGQLVTTDNFFELFKDVLNPKQLDGLRLLVTPFAQQQFNLTDDRRSLRPSLGVACLDCHVNGHTSGATHLVGDIRPQELRNRIDTPTLRGVNIQQLFGSQRALHTVEDFTEFEQRAAYFDGDPVAATRKGLNPLERGSQVHDMGEFQELLDFPPAPKLDIHGKLIPELATPAELRGQELFFGKAQCATCHEPPYYTDNTMHNLQLERFFEPRLINGLMASGDGPIKTFPLRGIKESPPYFHDGRLLTLEDTVEFFNIVLGTRLSADEKRDLVAFLRVL